MTKKPTKAQRDEAAYMALRRSIFNICAGACGEAMREDYILFPEHLSRIIPALKSVFHISDDSSLLNPGNLHHYSTPGSIAGFYFKDGGRA